METVETVDTSQLQLSGIRQSDPPDGVSAATRSLPTITVRCVLRFFLCGAHIFIIPNEMSVAKTACSSRAKLG